MQRPGPFLQKGYSILRRFSNERKETVKQALRDVLKESLPFFIEEAARERNSDKIKDGIGSLRMS
jgi:hypothetical protein